MVSYKEVGYFDVASNYKWLLHTWSLSVEWQFYILLPILILFIRKINVISIKKSLLVITIALLCFSLFISNKNPSLSYFFFLSRSWEMLLGGVISQLPTPVISIRQKKIFCWVSIVVLILCSILIDDSMVWPGLETIIPLTATSIILLMNTDNLILSNRVAQKIGLWSYSIYLYHWPLIVMSGIFFFESSMTIKISLLMLSILLGYISYTFVERKGGWLNIRLSRFFTLFISGFVLTSFSLFVFFSSGLPWRVSERVNEISSYSNDFFLPAEKCFVMSGDVSPECKFGPKKNDSDVDLVVIGDSHAYATLSSIIESNKNASIVFIAQSSCPAIPNIIRSSRPDCGKFMDNAFDAIKHKYTKANILVINRFSQYFYGENGSSISKDEFHFDNGCSDMECFFIAMAKAISTIGGDRHVFILEPIPDYPYDVIFVSARDAMINKTVELKEDIHRYKSRSKDINRQLITLSNKYKNITLLDPSAYLCDDRYCYASKNGFPLYRDSNHLNSRGSKLLVGLFKKIWD